MDKEQRFKTFSYFCGDFACEQYYIWLLGAQKYQVHAASQWQKDNTDILTIYQINYFVMVRWYVLNMMSSMQLNYDPYTCVACRCSLLTDTYIYIRQSEHEKVQIAMSMQKTHIICLQIARLTLNYIPLIWQGWNTHIVLSSCTWENKSKGKKYAIEILMCSEMHWVK